MLMSPWAPEPSLLGDAAITSWVTSSKSPNISMSHSLNCRVGRMMAALTSWSYWEG